MSAPVEAKVIAAGAGGGTGAIVADFVDYILSGSVYHHGSVPEAVSAMVLLACGGGLALLSGYLAPHTARPEDNAAPVVAVATPAPADADLSTVVQAATPVLAQPESAAEPAPVDK